MAKIDWPDFCTDGLIVVWRKDEELIALPIRNGRVGFGIHELQGQGASLLQQVTYQSSDIIDSVRPRKWAFWKTQEPKPQMLNPQPKPQPSNHEH